MASNSARDCSVCHEEYDEDERCPRVLPCSHSFCSDCINKLITQNRKNCPLCRRNFKATSARDVGVNTGLQDVLQLLKEMELKQGASSMGSEVSRAHLNVRDLKEQTKEHSSNIIARCLKAKEQINYEIKCYTDLRETMVQHSETIENALLIKLNEALSKNARRVEYVNEQIMRLEGQKTTLESNQKKREDILQRLKQADNFKLAGPLIDDAEICNSEAQICLQGFTEMMLKNEKTRHGMEKVARNTKDRIHVLQEILNSPLEGEDEVDLVMRAQKSETVFGKGNHGNCTGRSNNSKNPPTLADILKGRSRCKSKTRKRNRQARPNTAPQMAHPTSTFGVLQNSEPLWAILSGRGSYGPQYDGE